MLVVPLGRKRPVSGRTLTGIVFAFLFAAALPAVGKAQIIYSNFGTPPTSTGSGFLILGTGNLFGVPPTKAAVGFFTADAFVLDSVRVGLFAYNAPGSTPVSTVNASLFLGNASKPLTLIETVSLGGFIEKPLDFYTFDFTDFLVGANSYVWIGLTNTTGNIVWYQNGNGITGLTSGPTSSPDWPAATIQLQWMLEVTGRPAAAVPEPSAYASGGVIMLLIATWRRRRVSR